MIQFRIFKQFAAFSRLKLPFQMKSAWFFLAYCVFISSALGSPPPSLMQICEKPKNSSFMILPTPKRELILMDQGFCRAFNSSTKYNNIQGGTWKIRIYASHAFTRYFNSDITLNSSRYQIEIKDYEWAERGSREYFTPHEWKKPESHIFQLLDEPTNTFTISIEKNGHEFFLSAFHPKFLQAPNQYKHMQGQIDGVPVNQAQLINQPFYGYLHTPGESKLLGNEFTHRQMIFEVGYGFRIPLLRTKFGNIVYVPNVGIGIIVGQNRAALIRPGAWWDAEYTQDEYRVQGFGGSIGNRIEINGPKERMGIFYENRLGYYSVQSKFYDGQQRFNLGYQSNNIGIKFVIPSKKIARHLK
jgi:hypothetical protein